MPSASCEVVLFDLVGVLVEAPGVAVMRELAGISSDEEVWRRWLGCEWVRRFERGECTAEEFAVGLVLDWRLEVTPAEFLSEFARWPRPPAPGAADLVAEVGLHARVAALTNTNPVHWHAYGRWHLLDHFDDLFVSFVLGAVKPDPAVFERVARELGVQPDRVVFLDDNEENVVDATEVGYRARRVRGVDEARLALVDEGVIRSG